MTSPTCGHVTNFGNSSISMREIIIISILYKDLTRKNTFFRYVLDSIINSIINNLKLTLGMASKIFNQCGKKVKTKSQKTFGAIIDKFAIIYRG